MLGYIFNFYDYEGVALFFATQFQKGVDNIIDTDQTGFMKGKMYCSKCHLHIYCFFPL